MSFSMKPVRAFVVAVGMMGALLSAGAGSAAAAPATWNPGGQVLFVGSLTLTRAGLTATCPTFYLSIAAGGSGFVSTGITNTCTRPGGGGPITIVPMGTVTLDSGVYNMRFGSISQVDFRSPFPGTYVQGQFVVPFTNAAGATTSHITFNNTNIGSSIYATGTLSVPSGATVMPLLS